MTGMDAQFREAFRAYTVRNMPNRASLLRMVPRPELFVNVDDMVELNLRLGEFIDRNSAFEMFNLYSSMPVPEGLPLTDIQFDKEYFSDVEAESLEEAVMHGPNGIYYVPTGPKYLAHVGNETSSYDSLEEARAWFADRTGESFSTVFYPVVDEDLTDSVGTTWTIVPPDIGRLYDATENELYDRPVIDDPFL
jgi:hypothetical protein